MTSQLMRNRMQHFDVSEANFYPILFIQLLNAMFIKLSTQLRKLVFYNIYCYSHHRPQT